MTSSVKKSGLTLSVLVCLAICGSLAEKTNAASDPVGATDPPAVTQRLWENLRCPCGHCNRKTLETCTCKSGAKERDAIAVMVDDHLSAPFPKSHGEIYETVLGVYTNRFGDRILANYGKVPTWAIVMSIGGGLLLGLGVPWMIRRKQVQVQKGLRNLKKRKRRRR